MALGGGPSGYRPHVEGDELVAVEAVIVQVQHQPRAERAIGRRDPVEIEGLGRTGNGRGVLPRDRIVPQKGDMKLRRLGGIEIGVHHE